MVFPRVSTWTLWESLFSGEMSLKMFETMGLHLNLIDDVNDSEDISMMLNAKQLSEKVCLILEAKKVYSNQENIDSDEQMCETWGTTKND